MSDEIITKKELIDFQNGLIKVINEVDTSNPFMINSFALSLIDMGKHFLSESNRKLIKKSYSEKEIEDYLSKIQIKDYD